MRASATFHNIFGLFRVALRCLCYKLRWRGRQVRVSSNSWISLHAIIRPCRSAVITIGDHCEIHPYAMVISHGGNIRIGDFSSVNPFTVIYGIGNVWIGSNVRIATSVTVIPANHVQGTDEMPLTQSGITKVGIRIEDNVWIGAGARILDGVSIGKNAIVGAGSVVTRDVMPNSRVAGVPARTLACSGGQQ